MVEKKKITLLFTAVILICCFAKVSIAADEPIKVINSARLGVDTIAAERIPIGIPQDYKPCVAKLPDGELLLVYFHAGEDAEYAAKTVHEKMYIHRSADGGKTWSERKYYDLMGREPYFTAIKDGTVFITTHLLDQDIRNKAGYIYSYLHRSDDGGRTWTTIRIGYEDLLGAAKNAWTHTARNVLELNDGTLLFGVSCPNSADYIWRSKDKGLTWDKTQTCTFESAPQDYWQPLFAEAFMFQGRSNKIYSIHRVDQKLFPALAIKEIPNEKSDQFERMVVWESTDQGKTWVNPKDLGYYGEMYPSLLRLKDGRLLFTFTVRSINRPLGVQAVFGREDRNGLHFDFKKDRLVISYKTPDNLASGGGFGPTVQTNDGTFVTSYSYRTGDDKVHIEVARWKLPKRKRPKR